MYKIRGKKAVIIFVCKISTVFIPVLLIITLLSPVFVPKYYGTWATTKVMDGFYEMEENSIDVLFLGSSQIMTSISPMQIFDETGITSYNLGTEQQSLVTSYFLLKEVLRNHKPKVVFLDVLFIFPYYEDSALNSQEEIVRKTYDYMKWSPNKWEAVNTICALDAQHKLHNYIFPFLRFHSRWNSLEASDFTYLLKDKKNLWKGFSLNTDKTVFDFHGFACTDASAVEATSETMELYFEKIVSLCAENEISLVLIKTPRGFGSFTEAHHNSIQLLADKYDLPFLDFNEKTLFDEIGFNATTDCMDGSHVNYYGSIKITNYLAEFLCNNYSIEDKRKNPAYSDWVSDLETYITSVPR